MHTRTRIVATLGPATDQPGVLEAMLTAGLDVARVNFSHGTPDEHCGRIARIRNAAQKMQRQIAILADLPGPKLRVLLTAPIALVEGNEVSIAADENVTADLHVTEPEAIHDVRPGHRLLLDDGRLQLIAIRGERERVWARVTVGGPLLPNKGMNLPDTPLTIPAVTERDRMAIATAASAGVDWLALSFVRSPEAAAQLRVAAKACGLNVPVLAKMERPEAVERAAEIVETFDGIMVARGDLGVEIPLERVPSVQKRLIDLARTAGKPVITATDMLDSMRGNPRPTRAEASDVANAIYDGTDAVMLSGETAVGKYPVQAVACMDRIASETEAQMFQSERRRVSVPRAQIDDHITHTTCTLAEEIRADAIVTPTISGRTARLIARHRPRAAIVAPAPSEDVVRQLMLVWGLLTVPFTQASRVGEDRLETAVRVAHEHGALRAGQLIVVLAGHPVEGGDRFPTVRVVRVDETGRSITP